MQQKLSDTIALIARTPAALNALLRDLPDTWTHRNEGGNTWTAFDVVGHLIHSEHNNWIPRARTILEVGDARPFAALDRRGHTSEVQGKSMSQLLVEFASVRAANVEQLRALNLRDEDLNRRGLHPSLGPITLSELLATWAAHDLTHLHQISRILAHQYRDEVGPFIRFLGVLKCQGHSADA